MGLHSRAGDRTAATRLDVALVRRGLARSRGQARQLVSDGGVLVAGRPATKASLLVDETTTVALVAEPERWVGRAAYKLLHALDAFGPLGLTVHGRRCLDIGASTGGFTQVLLERGARSVTALDVGHGQLAAAVAADPRVEDRSGVNIRDVHAGDLGDAFDVVVADLSFISLRLVLEPLHRQLRPDGDAVLLVKPQFEVGRERLARTGVVTSAHERRRVLLDVVRSAAATGLRPQAVTTSPIEGAEGNVEYLLWAAPGRGADADDAALETMVATALAAPRKATP
jgi:23S rRNA (cytidine1920-2'-O)/16S rRNA (cytidine1409-2'-O)-methyltransferase